MIAGSRPVSGAMWANHPVLENGGHNKGRQLITLHAGTQAASNDSFSDRRRPVESGGHSV